MQQQDQIFWQHALPTAQRRLSSCLTTYVNINLVVLFTRKDISALAGYHHASTSSSSEWLSPLDRFTI